MDIFKYLRPVRKIGGRIRIDTFNKLLNESYKEKPADTLDGYELDTEISTDRDKVYYNPTTNDVAVVHRGTQGLRDVKTDLLYVLGVKDQRFKEARATHARVSAKYADADRQILGHSLGGLVAQDNADQPNVKEIITLAKPVLPRDMRRKRSKKQLDVRADIDPVTALSPIDSRVKKLRIETKTKNPVQAHSTDILKELPDDMQIGFD
jgi:hypothetical protein